MKKKVPDNPIYEANLKALRDRYPQIAARLEETPVNCDYEMRGTGVKRFVNVYSQKQQFYFYDQEDPMKDVSEQLGQLKLKNAKIAVFLGFGLGYEVSYFAGNMATSLGTAKILIIERDLELFKTALHMFNYTPMMGDKNIKLVVGEAEEDLFPIFAEFFRKDSAVMYLKAMKPMYHTSSLRLHKDYYLKAMKVLRESGLYALHFFGNCPEDSLIGVENMLDNIKEIVSHPGINLLYQKFAGKPAVVVSTGPSLNKNKHLLKGIEDKALLIAADASLRIMMDMGVKPHLVTSLERVESTARLLEGFNPDEVEDVYLAACPVVHPMMYELYSGPRIICYRNFDHFRWVGVEKGILDIKQSAGNMAFKLAEALGCNPIILIGQDLAFSRDGKTHASGTVYGENQETQNILEVMGNDGMPIKTDFMWNEFRKAYEIDVAGFSGRCVNSTEGGAYIKGTEIMTFQQAIDLFINEDFYPRKIIDQAIGQFSSDSKKEDILSVKKVIQGTKDDLTEMKKLCRSAVNIIEENESQLQSIIDGSADPDSDIEQIYKEIVKNRAQILSIQPTMQLFMMHIIQSYHLKFELDLHELPDLFEDDSLLQAHSIAKYLQWFAVIHDIVIICLGSLDKAEARIDELLSTM